MAIIKNLKKYNVQIGTLSVDRESAMTAAEPLLNDAGYTVTMKPGHVKHAERNIRTVKDGVRKVQASVKFPIFGPLIFYVVYSVITRINMWPNPKRPDQPTPIENLTLIKRNYAQDVFGPCLSYVRVDAKSGENDNSMDERALEGLYLFSNINQSGESSVMNIYTGRVVRRKLKRSDKAPMPQHIIDGLIATATKYNDQGLTFRNHQGDIVQDDDEHHIVEHEAQRAAVLASDNVSTEAVVMNDEQDTQTTLTTGVTQNHTFVGAQSDYRSEQESITHAEPTFNSTSDSTSDSVEPVEPMPNIATPSTTSATPSVDLTAPEPVRRSTRLANKPTKSWANVNKSRDKEITTAYSFHISMMKALRMHGKAGTKAMMKELSQIDELGTIRGVNLTPAMKKRAITSMLFFKEKYLSTGEFSKLKARLVAGGHRQDRTVYDDKDISSPTVSTENVYIVAGIAAMEGRRVLTVDIAGAYLKGKFKDGSDPIYMRLEKNVAEALCEVNPGYEVYRTSDGTLYVELLKPLYGLIEAGQLWYDNITGTLRTMKFIQNPYDKCVWNRIVHGRSPTDHYHPR